MRKHAPAATFYGAAGVIFKDMANRITRHMRLLPAALVALAALACGTARQGAPGPASPAVARELHPRPFAGPAQKTADTAWHPDILPGYEARQVDMGESFDGPVCCTVVRKRAPGHSRKAVLYVHGFNDYFFQSEMGERFTAEGYNFYAVDLRRYGRSLRPWQYPFDVRKIDEYFTDIDSALRIARLDGNDDITLSGHSTGGLTVLCYAAGRGAGAGVDRVVTDSPFLEWNFGPLHRKLLLPAVSLWGAVSPGTRIDQGDCDAYASSLLRDRHGEWEYDTDWKMTVSPPVKAGWVRAISRAQSRLMRHAGRIAVPVLVMRSDRGAHACAWDSACMSADIVLDPREIGRRGARMGKNPVVATIEGGMHDLILSAPPVRAAAYDTILNFIRTH